MKTSKLFLIYILAVLCLASCGNKKDETPVNLKGNSDIEVPYTENGGVKTIPVKLNGTEMDMIFDTGCSGLSISLLELKTLYKNNKLSANDLLSMGTTYAQIADGSIVENGTIKLREVEIGGKDGIVLHNVEASVAENQAAPLLLGNVVLDEVKSVEVDNVKKVIKFKRK